MGSTLVPASRCDLHPPNTCAWPRCGCCTSAAARCHPYLRRRRSQVATEVVGLIDQTALAAAYGTTLDADDKAQAKQRKKDDAKKKALVAALHTKVVQRFAAVPPLWSTRTPDVASTAVAKRVMTCYSCNGRATAFKPSILLLLSTCRPPTRSLPERPTVLIAYPTMLVALHAQALALADLHAAAPSTAALAQLDSAITSLFKWATAADHIKLTCRWHKAHDRAATALSALNESIEKAKTPVPKASAATLVAPTGQV